jgi:hypothetical protein
MKYVLSLILLLTAVYLLLPSPVFPPPPPDSLKSQEPGDMESIYRRAYFTNLSREQVLKYYSGNFPPTYIQYLLNYPPEESFTWIRDQTKSSWLQEIVHPLRESLFINGFYPTKPTEQININGVHYLNKITLHYFPSHPLTRLTVLGFIALAVYLIRRQYVKI